MTEKKNGKWKLLAILIPSLLAAYATVASTLIQVHGPSKDAVKALAKQNAQLIQNIEDEMRPKISALIAEARKERLEGMKDNDLLSERLAYLEGWLAARYKGTRSSYRPSSGSASSSSARPSKPPETRFEKAVERFSKIKAERKDIIPKLNIQALPVQVMEELDIESKR